MKLASSRTARLAVVPWFALAVLLPAAAVSASPCWVPPVAAPVIDPYREPACRWCPGNRGIEYETVWGMPVRAVAAGRVTFAGDVAGRRYVVVRHSNGWRATYGDLDEVRLAEGDLVVASLVVGTTTDRFHFGLRDDDGYRDPTPHLGELSYRPRLVPVDGSPGAPPGPAVLRCVGGNRAGVR